MKKEINRSQRVKRLKKNVLWTIALAILIPVTGCILLSVRVFQLKKQVAVLTEQLPVEEIQEEASGVYETTKVEESVRDTETKAEEPAKINPVKSSGKKVYLTFDDGPSSNTDQILDILKDYDVKATFFVVGKTDERSVKAYQRIVEEGHTLARLPIVTGMMKFRIEEAFARDLKFPAGIPVRNNGSMATYLPLYGRQLEYGEQGGYAGINRISDRYRNYLF